MVVISYCRFVWAEGEHREVNEDYVSNTFQGGPLLFEMNLLNTHVDGHI